MRIQKWVKIKTKKLRFIECLSRDLLWPCLVKPVWMSFRPWLSIKYFPVGYLTLALLTTNCSLFTYLLWIHLSTSNTFILLSFNTVTDPTRTVEAYPLLLAIRRRPRLSRPTHRPSSHTMSWPKMAWIQTQHGKIAWQRSDTEVFSISFSYKKNTNL